MALSEYSIYIPSRHVHHLSRSVDRKRIIATNQQAVELETALEQQSLYGWVFENSTLLGSDGISFNNHFEGVIPSGFVNIKEYIEFCLQERAHDAIGVEYGGVGSNLFGSFTTGFFKQSVGVALVDRRDFHGEEYKTRDHNMNHHVVEGDIQSPDTIEAVNKLIQYQKVDLIVERLIGGLSFIADEPYFLSQIANRWYQQLNTGGVLFAQLPISLSILIKAWESKIRAEYAGVLDFSSCERGEFIRLVKLDNAPQQLPLLSPGEVRKILKSKYLM